MRTVLSVPRGGDIGLLHLGVVLPAAEEAGEG